MSQTDPLQIKFSLEKDHYYSFRVESQGIYLIVDLRDPTGKPLGYSDYSPKIGDPAKIYFSPDFSGEYSLMVKRKNQEKNPKEGKFSIIINTTPETLEKYSLSQLNQDFEILKNALVETRVGFWYNTAIEFDSICNVQQRKIRDNMTVIDLYKILAPIIAFAKEGHCRIYYSDTMEAYLNQNAKYLPIIVKILNGKVYLLNDLNGHKTQGMQISKINDIDISKIMQSFLSIRPSDGYNISGKYHRIGRDFAEYYASYYNQTNATMSLELIGNNSTKTNFKYIPTINFKELGKLKRKVKEKILYSGYKENTDLTIDSVNKTALLTVNSFDEYTYKNGVKGFKKALHNYFDTIVQSKTEHLIIDVRKNEGGLQGMEDELLSYLITKEYHKYKYVQIPAFDFTFMKYTEHNTPNLQAEFVNRRKRDFFRAKDGRYLAKKGVFEGKHPKPTNFKGDLFILINGLTFSGGSEFAALAKNYTNAKFIGEETGGGYFGNTSGNFIWFILPNTKLTGRIPLEKYVLETIKNDIPFGRGIIPDYQIQPTITEYLNGSDAELEFAKKLIAE